MRFSMASCMALVAVVGTAVTGCGDKDVFVPQLASNERLISREAVARVNRDGQALVDARVVGDIDGDGIDDTVVISTWVVETGTIVRLESTTWVLYGGDPAGTIDLSTLPHLTGIGLPTEVAALGDVDGDGLADFMLGVGYLTGCGAMHAPFPDDAYSGAYLVYGRSARLAGEQPVSAVGVRLRNAVPCRDARVAALGDLDADGLDDYAITLQAGDISEPGKVFVFYGRSERPSVVDLDAAADAVLTAASPSVFTFPRVQRLGDVTGDGHDDFMLQVGIGAIGPEHGAGDEVRLVTGSATRLAGPLAARDIASSEFVDTHPCLIGADGIGAALGDLDGDGVDDFSVTSCQGLPFDDDFSGGQRVFYGRPAGFPPRVESGAADATIAISSLSGIVLAGGDIDGDGIRDLVVGDPGANDGTGAVHVIRGTSARLSGAVDVNDSIISYVGAPMRAPHCSGSAQSCMIQERVGEEITVGDVTGDGEPDLVIAAPAGGGVPVKEYTDFPMGHVYVVSPKL